MSDLFLLELGRIDAPAVVLLHGAPLPAAHLLPLAHVLATDWHVLLPELPGYGSSPRATGDTLQECRIRIDAMLARRKIGAAAFVGASLGGYRAFLQALDGSTIPRAIVEIGGFAGLSDAERRTFSEFAQALEEGADLTDPLIARCLSPAAQARQPHLVAELRHWMKTLDTTACAADLFATARCRDLRPELEKCSVPTLLITGADDMAVPPEHARDLAARLQTAELVILPATGHLPLAEHQPETIEKVVVFLRANSV